MIPEWRRLLEEQLARVHVDAGGEKEIIAAFEILLGLADDAGSTDYLTEEYVDGAIERAIAALKVGVGTGKLP